MGPAGIKDYRRLCSTIKFYLPILLPYKILILYVDTDVLFLEPPSKLWNYFAQMKPSNLMAIAKEEIEIETENNYIDYFRMKNLNTGIILMNLARMRENRFETMASKTFEIMQSHFHSSDQYVFNLIFGKFPEKLSNLAREFNWRWEMCENSKEIQAISVLHGTSDTFLRHAVDSAFQINSKRLKEFKSSDINVRNIRRKLFKSVIFQSVFETYQAVNLSWVLGGSQKMYIIFQEKLQARKVELYFDLCKTVVVPQVSNVFMKYDHSSVL